MKKLTSNDHEIIDGWYKDWGLPITPKSWYSDEAYILDNICAGQIYQMGNSKMFWIEGIVTNPNCEKELKKEGINKMINFLTNKSKELGAEIVMTSTPRESLENMFKNQGYKNAPEKYAHLGVLFGKVG